MTSICTSFIYHNFINLSLLLPRKKSFVLMKKNFEIFILHT